MTDVRHNPLAEDLDRVLEYTRDLWEDLRGRRIFITGGTGFFGGWLLESYAWANRRLNLRASALVLTRNREAFERQFPHLASDGSIGFHKGDVRDFVFPDGEFSHIIHAATTSARATFQGEDALVKFDTVAGGTRHTLDFAVACGARKFLMTSSGAVYGRQPSDMTHITEDYRGAPELMDIKSALGEGKRAAEFFCFYYARKYAIEIKIARCFSFVGPYLPLDIHYAIGNFIRDGLKGGPIKVVGDGTPYRSYLYAADLAIWLWTILFKGVDCYPYNVGSEEAVTIAALARRVAACFRETIGVEIAGTSEPGSTVERYVPATVRARELGLALKTDLNEAIERTIVYERYRTAYG
jgi:dTDP-glucose 4,6-dehydratase